MGNGARQASDDLAWDRTDESWADSMKQVRLKSTCQKIEALAQKVFEGPVTLVPPIIIGGFNVLYPIRIQDRPDEKILFRLSCPNQAILPQEKTEAEAATARYLAEFSTLPVPTIFHQGTEPDLGPYMVIRDLGTRRCMSGALEAPRDDPDDTPTLNPDISETDLKRLYTKMAQCVHRLAQPTSPRIGALVETSPGVFEVLGRPITLNMSNMFQLSNIPPAIFPPKGTTYQSADEFYVALADMQLATLVFQHNDMVDSEDDCRNKYVARQLFRKLAKQGWFSTFGFLEDDWSAGSAKCRPTLQAPDSTGSFRLWCDDFRPANVLVDEADDDQVLGVIDWEFAYAAPTQFALDCPWWLLLDIPEMWDAGVDDWITKYTSRLETWLSAMEEVERDYGDSERPVGSPAPLRLSAYMRESWSTGRFWLNYAARKSWAFDHVYWSYLDEKFFGEQAVDGEAVSKQLLWKTRVSLLSDEERAAMEPFVKTKMAEASDRRLVEWEEEEARQRLESILFCH
ncbi:phosphotransferase-3 [Rhypophila decipiens]|uniref:Phosphotransferase-3 n=1 Tax=Rhypophila decipiens TaxID=261697 RepID=A0AAN6Y7Q4_9PEZI|nr:phosphotransferase-3 [Rhypophila decipiens]